tara:strand:- start:416 stop:934 length:519 start_codon:yes stop_codon:yes gene_type:complete
MIKKLIKYIVIRFLLIIKHCPYIPFLKVIRLRSWCYRFALKSMGSNTYILDAVTILSPEKLELGKRVSIHENSLLACQGGVKIGDCVAIGSNFIISSSEHINKDTSKLIKDQGIKSLPVAIGNNVWIGARVTILMGVKIGNNSIIGAGSLVNKDIPDNVVAAGVPAKIIRKR